MKNAQPEDEFGFDLICASIAIHCLVQKKQKEQQRTVFHRLSTKKQQNWHDPVLVKTASSISIG